MTKHGKHRPSIPKGLVGGEKNYKLVTEQHFYRPMKPTKPARPSKPAPMPVKVVGTVKTRRGR